MFSGPCAVFSVCPAAVTAVAHLVCPGTVLDCRVGWGGPAAAPASASRLPAQSIATHRPRVLCPPPRHRRCISSVRPGTPPRQHHNNLAMSSTPPVISSEYIEGGIVTRPIQAMSGIFVGKHQAVTTQRLVHTSNSQCATPD